MDLEERTIEHAGDTCEECGAKLTPEELSDVLESGGPVLCSVHALEDEPGTLDEDLAYGTDDD